MTSVFERLKPLSPNFGPILPDVTLYSSIPLQGIQASNGLLPLPPPTAGEGLVAMSTLTSAFGSLALSSLVQAVELFP